MKNQFSRVSETLLDLLEYEISCAKKLLEILEKDHSALVLPQVDLERLNSKEKQQLIETLQQATETRVKFMADHHYEANAEGISFCISDLDVNNSLSDKFRELSELAQW